MTSPIDKLSGPAIAMSLPGDMTDEQVKERVEGGLKVGMMKSSRTGVPLTPEEFFEGHPVCKHYFDGTPQKITKGCDAPDGAIFTPDGAAGTLHEKIRAAGANGKPRPLTLLNFGSFSWPPYTYKLPTIAEMTEKHVKSGLLAVLNVYIREAHPIDGWALTSNDNEGICVAQTKTLKDRLAVAESFKAHSFFKGTPAEHMPLLVDDPTTQALDLAYEAPPERLVLVDQNFKVVFASGQGPFQYDKNGMIKVVEQYSAQATAGSRL